jgi:hypothetical protein
MGNRFLRKRIYISVALWLGNVLLWIVAASIKGVSINEARTISGWFWLSFFAVSALQAIPVWMFLNRRFPERRFGNAALVISLPLLILAGLWIFFLVGGSLTP